jgi:SsrA-binding protein
MASKKTASSDPDVQNIAVNRKAGFEYELGERYEAGLVLVGSEVKSLRNGSANISESWAVIRNGEAFVEGMRIGVLKHAAFGHGETRPRKLLLHEREIQQLQAEIDRRGMTIIVTRIYFRKGRAKLELAVARGRRDHDKREAIKDREAQREARSAMDRARRARTS